MRVLKQTAAVMEGLCKKLITEPEYDEASFIAQTLLEYCRSFNDGYLRLLSRASGRNQVRALESGYPVGSAGSADEREPAYFSASW